MEIQGVDIEVIHRIYSPVSLYHFMLTIKKVMTKNPYKGLGSCKLIYEKNPKKDINLFF